MSLDITSSERIERVHLLLSHGCVRGPLLFRVQDLGLGIRGSGLQIRFQDLGVRGKGLRSTCRVWGSGLRLLGSGFRVEGLGPSEHSILKGRVSWHLIEKCVYRGTSLIRNNPPVGPYSSPMPRDLC